MAPSTVRLPDDASKSNDRVAEVSRDLGPARRGIDGHVHAWRHRDGDRSFCRLGLPAPPFLDSDRMISLSPSSRNCRLEFVRPSSWPSLPSPLTVTSTLTSTVFPGTAVISTLMEGDVDGDRGAGSRIETVLLMDLDIGRRPCLPSTGRVSRRQERFEDA